MLASLEELRCWQLCSRGAGHLSDKLLGTCAGAYTAAYGASSLWSIALAAIGSIYGCYIDGCYTHTRQFERFAYSVCLWSMVGGTAFICFALRSWCRFGLAGKQVRCMCCMAACILRALGIVFAAPCMHGDGRYGTSKTSTSMCVVIAGCVVL